MKEFKITLVVRQESMKEYTPAAVGHALMELLDTTNLKVQDLAVQPYSRGMVGKTEWVKRRNSHDALAPKKSEQTSK